MPSIIPGSLSPFARAPQIQNANYRIPLHHTVGLKSRGFGDGTCGRTNTGWYFDPADGLLKSAAANEERIEAKGLLVEGASTNECLYNRDLSNGEWSKEGPPTITQNQVGIDGVSNKAWTVEDDDNVNRERVYQNNPCPDDSNPWCFSLFIKKTTGTVTSYPCIEFGFSGGSPTSIGGIVINTRTGVLVDEVGYPADNKGIESHGDWWRVWAVIANNSSGNTGAFMYLWPSFNSDGTGTEDETAIGSCVIDFVQFEENQLYPTSPILTTASPVTRNTDAGQYTWPLPDAIDTMLADEGTVVCLWTPGFDSAAVTSGNHDIINVNDLSANSIFLLDSNDRLYTYDGTLYHSRVLSWARGTTYIVAIRWGYDDSGIKFDVGYSDGSGWTWSVGGAFDGSYLVGTALSLGNTEFPFHIKNIYFHGLLTQAQVEAMY